MGCQMATNQRDPDRDENPERDPERDPEIPNILSLPTEVLVKIMSFLPETLDKINLRYVSRRLRSISETPLIWRVVVWSDCDRREEKCLYNALKVCGVHIRQLSFPQHVIGPIALPTIVKTVGKENGQTILKLLQMSEVVKILQYCGNVTHLSLPAVDYSISHGDDLDEELKPVIRKMVHLVVSNAYYHHSFQPTLKLSSKEYRKFSQYCGDVAQLPDLDSIPRGDDPDEELSEAIQKMEHLAVLNVHCHGSFQPYLTLKIPLKELTIHAAIYSSLRSLTIVYREKDSKGSIERWVENGFSPPNLNIVLDSSWYSAQAWYREFLLAAWARWNSQVPAGRVACLKLYSSYKVPLNLFQNAPVFQLRYGEAATYPFVQPSSIGEWLLLTDHDDGSRKAAICIRQNASVQSRMYEIIGDHGVDDQDNNVTDLTELDLSNYKFDCTQLVTAYPQLQRLNLRDNRNLRVEDLQVIATCCSNLQGLNISIKDTEFFLKMWEILSGMKLSHLRMESLFFKKPSRLDDVQVKHLIAIFQQCITLRALELCHDFSIPFDNYKLLSHFPSLEYCRLYRYKYSICTQDILTTCKRLRCFYFNYSHYCIGCVAQLPLMSAYNSNLQQLCILSIHTDLHDTFMDTVSAHGGLIHVAFFVHSVSSNGVTTLIRNSPNLLSFRLHELKERTKNYSSSLSASLSKKFADRKLFTSGLFSIIRPVHEYVIYHDESSDYDGTYVDYDQWLQNTDLLSLWPPNHFCGLQYDTRY